MTRADFDGWPQAQRRAFLINAYNAFTVDLILTRYPKLKSIRDLGSLFSSPWKQSFFTLFGEEQSLDGIEHGLLRGAPDFDDPRIHFAVNCASIGSALRPEAYWAEVLDAQLEDQTRRFFGDRTRNRFDATSATLYLSSILDWYAELSNAPSAAARRSAPLSRATRNSWASTRPPPGVWLRARSTSNFWTTTGR